jgi:hypothetical protein
MSTDMIRIRTALDIVPGNPMVSTMYFDSTATDPPTAASAVSDFWDALAPLLGTALAYQVEGTCEFIQDTTGNLVGSDTTGTFAAENGSAGGNLLPYATQGLIRWGTGAIVNGRVLKGRTFIPGLTEDANTAGYPLAATVTAINVAAGDFIAAAAGFGVWSRPVATGPHTRAGAFHNAYTWSTWGQFAVLRSRRD